MLQTTQATRQVIENFEGIELSAYQDSVGVWTIGFGHTGPDVRPGLTISQGVADLLLTSDLHAFEIRLNAMLGAAETNQNQYDALISFSYNLGSGALQHSTLLRNHLAGNFTAAAGQFGLWIHAGGRVLAGLVRRRAWEAELYSTPVA